MPVIPEQIPTCGHTTADALSRWPIANTYTQRLRPMCPLAATIAALPLTQWDKASGPTSGSTSRVSWLSITQSLYWITLSYSWLKYNIESPNKMQVVLHSLLFPALNIKIYFKYWCFLIFLYIPYLIEIVCRSGPPRLVQGLEPSVGTLANRSLSFSCRVECHPLCAINWFRNNQSLEPISDVYQGVYYRIETVEHEIDDRNAVFGSITSYLHIHNSSLIDDNDVFQCRSDDNGIGPAVGSQVIYRLEC